MLTAHSRCGRLLAPRPVLAGCSCKGPAAGRDSACAGCLSTALLLHAYNPGASRACHRLATRGLLCENASCPARHLHGSGWAPCRPDPPGAAAALLLPPLQLAAEMKAKGIERNVHTYTALMNVCIKCSKHTLALDTYKLMRQASLPARFSDALHTRARVGPVLGAWEGLQQRAWCKCTGSTRVFRDSNACMSAQAKTIDHVCRLLCGSPLAPCRVYAFPLRESGPRERSSQPLMAGSHNPPLSLRRRRPITPSITQPPGHPLSPSAGSLHPQRGESPPWRLLPVVSSGLLQGRGEHLGKSGLDGPAVTSGVTCSQGAGDSSGKEKVKGSQSFQSNSCTNSVVLRSANCALRCSSSRTASWGHMLAGMATSTERSLAHLFSPQNSLLAAMVRQSLAPVNQPSLQLAVLATMVYLAGGRRAKFAGEGGG